VWCFTECCKRFLDAAFTAVGELPLGSHAVYRADRNQLLLVVNANTLPLGHDVSFVHNMHVHICASYACAYVSAGHMPCTVVMDGCLRNVAGISVGSMVVTAD
jgi:hypothetical protein